MAGINIVRMSAKSQIIIDQIFENKSIKNKVMSPNHMYLGNIKTDKLRKGCVYYKSLNHTGEDVIEFHYHRTSLSCCSGKGLPSRPSREVHQRAFNGNWTSQAEDYEIFRYQQTNIHKFYSSAALRFQGNMI